MLRTCAGLLFYRTMTLFASAFDQVRNEIYEN